MKGNGCFDRRGTGRYRRSQDDLIQSGIKDHLPEDVVLILRTEE